MFQFDVKNNFKIANKDFVSTEAGFYVPTYH